VSFPATQAAHDERKTGANPIDSTDNHQRWRASVIALPAMGRLVSQHRVGGSRDGHRGVFAGLYRE
jgi:hypothetical protein